MAAVPNIAAFYNAFEGDHLDKFLLDGALEEQLPLIHQPQVTTIRHLYELGQMENRLANLQLALNDIRHQNELGQMENMLANLQLALNEVTLWSRRAATNPYSQSVLFTLFNEGVYNQVVAAARNPDSWTIQQHTNFLASLRAHGKNFANYVVEGRNIEEMYNHLQLTANRVFYVVRVNYPQPCEMLQGFKHHVDPAFRGRIGWRVHTHNLYVIEKLGDNNLNALALNTGIPHVAVQSHDREVAINVFHAIRPFIL